MKYLLKFDGWLLDKFQRFSDFVSKKTGIGSVNYKIADCCLTLYVVMTLTHCIIEGFGGLKIILSLACLANGFIWRINLQRNIEVESQLHAGEEKARKPQNVNYIAIRVLSCCVFIISFVFQFFLERKLFIKILDVASWFNFFLFAYFLSCSGLPRQKGKIRQWVRSLFGRRELVPVRNK